MITLNDLSQANARVTLPAGIHKDCILLDINAEYSKPDSEGISKVRYILDIQTPTYPLINVVLYSDTALSIAVGELIAQLNLKTTEILPVLQQLIDNKTKFIISANPDKYEKEGKEIDVINYAFKEIKDRINKTSIAPGSKLNTTRVSKK